MLLLYASYMTIPTTVRFFHLLVLASVILNRILRSRYYGVTEKNTIVLIFTGAIYFVKGNTEPLVKSFGIYDIYLRLHCLARSSIFLYKCLGNRERSGFCFNCATIYWQGVNFLFLNSERNVKGKGETENE